MTFASQTMRIRSTTEVPSLAKTDPLPISHFWAVSKHLRLMDGGLHVDGGVNGGLNVYGGANVDVALTKAEELEVAPLTRTEEVEVAYSPRKLIMCQSWAEIASSNAGMVPILFFFKIGEKI